MSISDDNLPGCSDGSGSWTRAAMPTPSPFPHTASLSNESRQPSPAQRLCWSEAKNIRPPQTQLCAFTDSYCVGHSNTCTYFSMASLASTTPSLSIHTSCLSLSQIINKHGSERNMWTQSLQCCCNLLLRHYVEGGVFNNSHYPVSRLSTLSAFFHVFIFYFFWSCKLIRYLL